MVEPNERNYRISVHCLQFVIGKCLTNMLLLRIRNVAIASFRPSVKVSSGYAIFCFCASRFCNIGDAIGKIESS